MTGRPENFRRGGSGEAAATPDATCTAARHDATRAAYRAGCRCPGAVEANREYNRNYYRAARSLDAFRERHNEAVRLSKQRQRADPATRERINARNRKSAQRRREQAAYDTRHGLDAVVVQRLAAGDAVPHNRAERLEAVRQLRHRGLAYKQIAARLNLIERQVHRDLAALGLTQQGAVA